VNDRDFDFLLSSSNSSSSNGNTVGGGGGSSSVVKPLAMFKCRDGFLLCYDAFFFLVDYKGSHYRKQYDKVEWISIPQAVAFYYPYIVAFDSQMIEVRHVETASVTIQKKAGTYWTHYNILFFCSCRVNSFKSWLETTCNACALVPLHMVCKV
jgi:hypothetical protein